MRVNNTGVRLNWNARGQERVAQNAANLISMGYYENAFERIMGNQAVDTPLGEDTEVSEEIYRNFAIFMPDIDVLDVRVTGDEKGDVLLEVDIANE